TVDAVVAFVIASAAARGSSPSSPPGGGAALSLDGAASSPDLPPSAGALSVPESALEADPSELDLQAPVNANPSARIVSRGGRTRSNGRTIWARHAIRKSAGALSHRNGEGAASRDPVWPGSRPASRTVGPSEVRGRATPTGGHRLAIFD